MLAILLTFSQPSRAKANIGPMMNVYWVVTRGPLVLGPRCIAPAAPAIVRALFVVI